VLNVLWLQVQIAVPCRLRSRENVLAVMMCSLHQEKLVTTNILAALKLTVILFMPASD